MDTDCSKFHKSQAARGHNLQELFIASGVIILKLFFVLVKKEKV